MQRCQDWILVEGAVERIVEDIVAVVNGDWEMMATVLVLELDAVSGVVGIRDLPFMMQLSTDRIDTSYGY